MLDEILAVNILFGANSQETRAFQVDVVSINSTPDSHLFPATRLQ